MLTGARYHSYVREHPVRKFWIHVFRIMREDETKVDRQRNFELEEIRRTSVLDFDCFPIMIIIAKGAGGGTNSTGFVEQKREKDYPHRYGWFGRLAGT